MSRKKDQNQNRLTQKGSLLVIIIFLSQAYRQCPNDEFCKRCVRVVSDTFQCLVCQNAYLDPRTESCIPSLHTIEKCVTYHPYIPHYCFECELGYYLGVEGGCHECSENCAICDAKECFACFDRISVVHGQCDLQSPLCPLANCQICGKHGACIMCFNGLAVDENAQCVPSCQNCMKVSVNNECEECWTGFYLDSKLKCVAKQEHKTAWYVFAVLMISLIIMGMAIFVKRENQSQTSYPNADEYSHLYSQSFE